MNRRLQQRLIAIVAALALGATAAADAFALHPCPHHDGAAAPDAPSTHAHHAPSSAGHDSHEAKAPVDHGTEEQGPCTCVGSCTLTPAFVAGRPPVAATAGPIGTAGEPASTSKAAPVRLIAHFLPFATAPPIH